MMTINAQLLTKSIFPLFSLCLFHFTFILAWLKFIGLPDLILTFQSYKRYNNSCNKMISSYKKKKDDLKWIIDPIPSSVKMTTNARLLNQKFSHFLFHFKFYVCMTSAFWLMDSMTWLINSDTPKFPIVQ